MKVRRPSTPACAIASSGLGANGIGSSAALNEALGLHNAGRFQEAQQLCMKVLHQLPTCADAWHLLAVTVWQQGDHQAAENHLSRAIALQPHHPVYYNHLGVFYTERRHYAKAETTLRHALLLSSQLADSHCNLGRVLMLTQRYPEAMDSYRQALRIDPSYAVALANMAVVFQRIGDYQQAVEYYRRALEIDAGQPDWWANLGATCLSMGHFPEAMKHFRQALSLSPRHLIAANGLTATCCATGLLEQAAAIAQRTLLHHPDNPEATAKIAWVYQHTADWKALETILPRLHQQTIDALQKNQVPAEQPLALISQTTDLALSLAVTRTYSQSIAARATSAAKPYVQQRRHVSSDGLTTIGYLSADFRSHAVAHQCVDLFKQHDRRKFRICAFSVGPDDNSDYRRRIAQSCDRFVDLAAADTRSGAKTIHDERVDILVDLMGHTQHNRQDICALRPAPVQVSYLGFLASSGADYMDYLIGDKVVTPPEHAPFYSEKLIRMPFCYQIISTPPPAEGQWTRDRAALPEDAFVFCCFNQVYKIDPAIFRCWMTILRGSPGSVLWLYRSNQVAENHLKAEAARHGVAPKRLIFSDKVPLSDHLARLSLADLSLDTVAYNGGATTANALLAGVPVITTMGHHFVSRMSASHLIALGLDALVAQDLDHYARIAVSLARCPGEVAVLRQHLREQVATAPLFDPARFAKHLESAYRIIWRRYANGQRPTHIDLEETTNQVDDRHRFLKDWRRSYDDTQH